MPANAIQSDAHRRAERSRADTHAASLGERPCACVICCRWTHAAACCVAGWSARPPNTMVHLHILMEIKIIFSLLSASADDTNPDRSGNVCTRERALVRPHRSVPAGARARALAPSPAVQPRDRDARLLATGECMGRPLA